MTDEPLLSPGEIVLQEIGMTAAARELLLNASTVWRWSQPAPKGTGGIVPSRYHTQLMRLAQRLGRRLTSEDLVMGRERVEELQHAS